VFHLNFVKIELRGFKSFADKVEIPFKEGVTAIIGPNGCGKSNVADAIRWTLGEQSAKSLRGKSMQDVIFAGTEKRKSMSYCEVSLYFNNDKHNIFPTLPFDEVTITRKLDRSGLSEYYINRTRCRMKDIINLFHDTGIGKEGYSIIGQGRIDEILSAKPDDRRNIFEEAAGISKFRAQRIEAERKLEKTALNLQTANEIIAEIERQLTPLKRQAETAEKYFELKRQLKQNEVNLYIYNYENNRSIKQKIYDRLSDCEKNLKIKETQYNDCVRRYESCLRESSGIDRVFEENNAELLALKVDAERSAGQANVLKERISHLQAEQNRLNAELQSVDMQLSVSADLIKKTEQKKEEELAKYLECSKSYEDASTKLEYLSKSLKGQESDLEARNFEYVTAIEELGTLKSNLSGFIAEKSIGEERAKNLLSLLNGKKSKLDEETTNLAVYDGKIRTAKEKLRELTTAYNEVLSLKMDAQAAIQGFSEDVVALNAKLGIAEGNLRLLTSIKNEYQGYQEAVKRLMQDAKSDPMLGSRIMGVLAEVINVPSEYEAAIEYALGGALQNVLVETERDAGDLIAYLKQKNYGRVTFRPLTSCRARTLDGGARGVLEELGCFGLASKLVSYDKKFDGFIQTLLGGTVVVDNINTAIRLFKKYNQAFKIVTLDGDIFSRGGEITGGSRRNQTNGLLSQEKQIEQAKLNLERIKSNIAQMNAQRAERENEIRESEEKIAEFSKNISELRIEITLNEDKAKQASDITQILEEEIRRDAAEYETVFASVKELSQKIGSIDRLEEDVKQKRQQYGSLLEASKNRNSEQKNDRETLSEQVMDLRLKLAGHKSVLDGCEADLFRFRREMQNTEEEKLDIIAEIKNVQNNLDSIKSAPERTEFSAVDLARIEVLEKEIAGLSDKKRRISEEIVSLDAEKTAIFNEKNALMEKKIRDEAMLENVDIEIRNQQEHILEEYDLTYDSALEYKDEEFKAYGAVTVISDLKKSISRLGEVNPLAVETLKETEARHEECVTQRDDIQAAYNDIIKVIQELTGEMQVKFTDAFDKINENFREVFKQLFGGGKGELRLDMKETDDPLEAGIEIYSQPPGKKLQHISLLSGGEKALTAISILFAILKLKPMPFCVLDEIEAALDDANANLFADFLKKFSDDTQFIVITHRKPTMRHADSIFGVTMEEKGVTKIVSIEFEEAVKHATQDN
jgi:chromosome segregation protein